MLLWKTIDVADNERALVFCRNRLETVLEPGHHRVSQLNGKIKYDLYDVSDVIFTHKNDKFMLNTHKQILTEYLQRYELSDHQVGLFYRDNHLVEVLEPGAFRAVWKGVEDVRLDIIDITENYAINEELLGLLARSLKMSQQKGILQAISYAEVPDEHVGLLVVNGKLEKMLTPGSYGYWKYNRSIVITLMDLRLQSVDVSGQEILTKDRVSLRINLSASYKIADAKNVAMKLSDYNSFIYRELQLRLREAVGTQTLDYLLEDKDSLNVVVAHGIRDKLAEYGIDMISVGVKDIILPGDMKAILNQVVEAQKECEANLIKRREETQAMRSLHNTAKMMENSPVLLRLKELEALERITGRIDKISVYGGLDGVLNDLVTLAPRRTAG